MRRIVALAVGVALAALALEQPTESQTRSQEELRKPFIGTWRLISIEGGGNTTNRGSKPTGVIY
jgi:hypothetical protein